MLTKSTCQNFGGHLEFDVEDTGKEIECPHCQQTTLLRAPFRPAPPKVKPAAIGWWILVLLLLGVIGIISVLSIHHSDAVSNAAAGVGGMAILIIGCIGAVLVFVLACFWTIFPWMVYSMLKRMNDTLEKIEANTRKP
jgi:hypothetical protein